MKKLDTIKAIAFGYLLFLVLIRLLPYGFPTLRTWGFNHHVFLPEGLQIIFFAVTGIALILPFIPKTEKLSGKLIDKTDYVIFTSHFRYIVWGVLAIIGMMVFYIFSQEIHLLGDGYFVIQNLTLENPLLYKTSEYGVVHFYDIARRLLGPADRPTAEFTVRMISVLAGVAYIFLAIKISYLLSDNKAKRLLILLTLMLSGAILLFFGYSEYYPVIWILVLAYLWLSLRYLISGKGIIWAVAILVIGIIMHFSMVLVAPSVLVLILGRGRGHESLKRYKPAIMGIIGTGCFVILFVFFKYYNSNLYVQDIFLPLFEGKPSAPEYAVFSSGHMLDMLNEIILVAPLLPLLLLLAAGNYKSALRDKYLLFLLVSSFGFILFFLTADPKLSMGRDWDLFSICLLVPGLLSLLLLSKPRLVRIMNLIPSMALVMIVFAGAFVYANVSRSGAIAYFESLIKMDMPKSLSSLTILKSYFQDEGNNAKLESIKNIYQRNFANDIRITHALEAISTGDLTITDRLAAMIKPDKYNADYHRLKANLFALTGKLREAIEEMDMALQLRPKAPVYYFDRARMYFGRNELDKARDDLYKGYSIAPNSNYFFDGFSYYYMTVKEWDSTLKYSQMWREADLNQPNALYYTAKAHIFKGDIQTAGLYFDSLLAFPRNDSLINLKRNEIRFLLDKVKGE